MSPFAPLSVPLFHLPARPRWRRALALLATGLAMAWPAARAATPPPPGSPKAAVLYHNYCSVCHGDKGDGQSRATGALSTPPRDFTSEASRRELTTERIAAAITHGRPGTAMTAWRSQLSAADIEALADHVYTRYVQGRPATAPAAPISGTHAHGGRQADATAAAPAVDMSAAFPGGLKGRLTDGAGFYRANCVACHGELGDGAGPRAYFINPKPRNFTEAASRARYNRIALYAAVAEGRNGSEMPAWSKVATPQQIADVAEYVFQRFVIAGAPGQAAVKP
jgi:mono/diheme cytochrome c family protein